MQPEDIQRLKAGITKPAKVETKPQLKASLLRRLLVQLINKLNDKLK